MRQFELQTRNHFQVYAYAAAAGISLAMLLLVLLFATPARSADVGGPPTYVPQAVYPAAPVTPNPCYAMFHRHRGADGHTLQRVGPEEVPVVGRLSGMPVLEF